MSLLTSVYPEFVRRMGFKNEEGRIALAIYALGLTGEAGETAEHVKKLLDRNRGIDINVMKLELGDVLWYLQALANSFGLTLEQIAQANIDKLNARHSAGTHGWAQAHPKPGVGG